MREEVPGQVLSDGKRGHVFHGTGLSEKGVEAGFCLLDDVCSVSCRVGDDATDVGGYRLRGLHFPIVIDGNVGRDGLFHLFKEGFRGKDVGSAYNDVHRALASRMLIQDRHGGHPRHGQCPCLVRVFGATVVGEPLQAVSFLQLGVCFFVEAFTREPSCRV